MKALLPTHPEEVLKAIKSGALSQRIVHRKRKDGTTCSTGKTPAMVITKRPTCWVYYCFRCKMYGEIPFERNTPKETLNLIKMNRIKRYITERKKQILPEDFIALSHEKGPKEARNWLWKYGIGLSLWQKYEIGWSDMYKRVIIPIKEKNKNVGFLARDIGFITNNENPLYNAPKYLLSTIGNRKYFICESKKAKKLVIVEDVISAIKIFENTKNINTLALLNSSIDAKKILQNYRGLSLYIWLDNNKRSKSVMQTVRLSQFGFNVKHIYTIQDPKAYLGDEIKNILLNKRVKSYA